ncbi:alpha/beta hydrolase [Persicimonas caeni]|uniref:Alpha/beta hydrolase n=1 Tax=Persicimonas caeni TaxID=2292766 RepID=A0A4Y6PYM8_PERCE|nr:alpha/beta fold hydrolase [Persicimonas caeni]QDG53432.1 alpha/beta hydrolase [Persicimonas caeni]QED34653.1 alpha/beta hydrolase [Persicimonas caeni]
MASTFKSPKAKDRIIDWFDRFRGRLSAPTETCRLDTPFGETHVLVGGPEDAPALVLLHGQMATSAHVLVEMAPLLERFRVYAVDIVGQSPMGHDELLSVKNNDYGAWLRDVLDGLRLDKPHVVGVSFGGFVALRLAALAPERIERLALIVPAGVVKSHWSGWFKIGIPMAMYLLAPTQKRLEAFLAHMMTTRDEEWEAYMGEVFQAVNLGRVKIPRLAKVGEFDELRAPTIVLAADKDLSFPGEQVISRVEKLIPSLEATELMADCRHCPPTTDEFRGWLTERISGFFTA